MGNYKTGGCGDIVGRGVEEREGGMGCAFLIDLSWLRSIGILDFLASPTSASASGSPLTNTNQYTRKPTYATIAR